MAHRRVSATAPHQVPVRQPPELPEPVQVRLTSPLALRVTVKVSFDWGATAVTA